MSLSTLHAASIAPADPHPLPDGFDTTPCPGEYGALPAIAALRQHAYDRALRDALNDDKSLICTQLYCSEVPVFSSLVREALQSCHFGRVFKERPTLGCEQRDATDHDRLTHLITLIEALKKIEEGGDIHETWLSINRGTMNPDLARRKDFARALREQLEKPASLADLRFALLFTHASHPRQKDDPQPAPDV